MTFDPAPFAALFGQGEHLAWWQMALRAAVIFGAAWALLRIAGRRAFSQQTAFDICIILLRAQAHSLVRWRRRRCWSRCIG